MVLFTHNECKERYNSCNLCRRVGFALTASHTNWRKLVTCMLMRYIPIFRMVKNGQKFITVYSEFGSRYHHRRCITEDFSSFREEMFTVEFGNTATQTASLSILQCICIAVTVRWMYLHTVAETATKHFMALNERDCIILDSFLMLFSCWLHWKQCLSVDNWEISFPKAKQQIPLAQLCYT